MSPDEAEPGPDPVDVPSAPAQVSASESTSSEESSDTNIDTTVTSPATDAGSLDPDLISTTSTVAPSSSDINIPAVVPVPIVPSSDDLTTPPPSSIPTLHPRYLILSSDSETPSWSDHLTTDAHAFYIGFFIILLFVWQAIVRLPIFSRLLTSKPSTTPPITSPIITVSADRNIRESFQRFQRSYAGVFFLMSAADWLQGPYVYALYNYYGFDKGTIGQLFIIGFASSLVCGTMVGSLADKYGRKKLCLTYGIIYSIASATKHFNDFWILAFGRLLSGISTSILYSSFEAWMIHQHHASGYPEEWLSQTFAMCTMGNGIVAIVSGVCAWGVNSMVGPVGPFDLAIVCLITGTIVISLTWTENRGNAEAGLSTSFLHAASTAAKDPKIVLLGFTQSLFEGSMYVFVFMWTPTLEESSNNTDVHHGWVFASFMLCVLIGSSIFRLLLASGRRVEMILLGALLTASFAIITPALVQRHIIQLIAFCIFESCVGIFWPTMGTLRSRLVPEDVRATIMTFFRIPLNIIVVLTLTNIKNLSSRTVFTLCFSCITLSALCLYRLTRYGIAEKTTTSQQKHDTPRGHMERGEKENIKEKSTTSPTRGRASPTPPLSSAAVIGTRRRRTLDANLRK